MLLLNHVLTSTVFWLNHRWSYGMDELIHLTGTYGCHYLSMPKPNKQQTHVIISVTGCKHNLQVTKITLLWKGNVIKILVWRSNYTHYKVRDEINNPFRNFNGCTVEVWNGLIISPQTLLRMQLLIQEDISYTRLKGEVIKMFPVKHMKSILPKWHFSVTMKHILYTTGTAK